MDTFIRDAELISILRKIQQQDEPSFATIVSANDPYGFDVREPGRYERIKPNYSLEPFEGAVKIYYNGWRREGVGFIDWSSIRKGLDLVNTIRLFVPRVWGSGNSQTDWVNPFLVGPGSCSTETYLTIGPFDSIQIAENALSYIHTKFFHVMVSLVKNTQQAMRRVYSYVPLQDFTKTWSDDELFAKYQLTQEEIDYINSAIQHEDANDE